MSNNSNPLSERLPDHLRLKGAFLTLLVVVFAWAYWPTMRDLISAWWNIDDYSHGFLVVPVAGFLLWLRREQMPVIRPALFPVGLVVIAGAAAIRWIGASYFIEAFDGWSMIIWIVGVVWLMGGWPLVRWALPPIGFLFFMIPLPYRVETALSLPLQTIAAKGSAWLLQMLGQPAIQEGTTIIVDDVQLEIVRACSGLRMFMGVLALAYVFVLISRRPWWDKAVVFVGAFPVAVIANIIRITTTALLYQLSDSEDFRKLIHDNAGLFTILVAAVLLGLLTLYLKRLVVESQTITSRELISSVQS